MGTRHLIKIILNKKEILSNYGQWDGYIDGQGYEIARFFYRPDLDDFLKSFKYRCKSLGFASDKDIEDAWVECGAERGSGSVSMEVSDKHSRLFPQYSRDTGSKILDLILKHSGLNRLKTIKASNGGWIEYIYTINLDTEKITIFDCYYKKKHILKIKDFTLENLKKIVDEKKD